jgi:hypothetical protein
MFDRFDANHDGALDQAEFRSLVRARARRSVAGRR